MDEASRAKRTAALEEKKRRLEELKRRRQKSASTSTSSLLNHSSSGASLSDSGAGQGNLDDYIDGLLSNPAPSVASVSTPLSTPAKPNLITSMSSNTLGEDANIPSTPIATSVNPPSITTTATPITTTAPVTKKIVETFTAGTQTEEDEFPPELIAEDKEQDEKNDNTEDKEYPENVTTNERNDEDSTVIPPAQILSPEEKDKTISSDPFASFFVHASKKVERLLGAPILADLLVDTGYDEALDEEDEDGTGGTGQSKTTDVSAVKNADDASFGLVSGRATYECSKWTNARDITCMDWSPTHKELIVTGYHMPGATITATSMSHHTQHFHHFDKSTAASAAGAAATRGSNSSSMKKISSASIVPKPGETQQADGLALVWSLAMTNRPEHIFTCGSPLLCTKFHPVETHLLVGGTQCGQLVVWDMRMGRLPVQRSSLSTVANKLKGHSHPICSLEVAEGGSGLVSADTNGKVNFWSLANLRDPAESINLTGSNVSSLAVAPETNSIIVGDELGGIHTILAQNINSATAGATSSAARSSSTSRRAVKKMNGGHTDNNGHFGMITGISTKVLPRSNTSSHRSGSVARGFLRGSNGLVLTCGVDWTTKLWAPAYKDDPILSFFSPCYDYMADVQWSPTNPSIFATASCKGSLALWNLASDLDEPLTGPEGIPIEMDMDASLSRGGMNKLKWSADGRRIAVASSDRLHVLGMTEEVSKPKADDETKMITNLTSRGFLDEL